MRSHSIDIRGGEIRLKFGDAIGQFENLRIRFVEQTGELIPLLRDFLDPIPKVPVALALRLLRLTWPANIGVVNRPR